jgi:signal transduction histidine kinase
MNLYTQRLRWKQLIVVSAVLIGLGSLWYTSALVEKLANEERKKVELWAKATETLASAADPAMDLSFVFDVIKDNQTIPVILTTETDSIITSRNLDSTQSENPGYLAAKLSEMKETAQPIEVKLIAGKNLIYYSHSNLLKQLQIFPFVQLGVIGLFIFVSYLAFSSSRRAEQDQVWVGMSKETAHQLGTPLSSLMAWVEYMKMKELDKEMIGELEKDVNRLNVITERFSKIGSSPELTNQNVYEVIEESADYMRARSPRKVNIYFSENTEKHILVPLNAPLFAWVVENLFRNAVDAMEGAGQIIISIASQGKHVIIDVEDTGKGIPRSRLKTVFQPGFTTKKRGWGLGLSLSKRIIEIYHGGKIFVKESLLNKGTTFRIVLNLEA